jgi:ATP-dependent Clp protease ATP-binding subunit ClpA
MDYFKGILFLTTNRVGKFDEAFMSRIHLQIGYDPLDDAARREIWDNNFKKLEEEQGKDTHPITFDYSAKEYVRRAQEVRELEWNGREIRNGKDRCQHTW